MQVLEAGSDLVDTPRCEAVFIYNFAVFKNGKTEKTGKRTIVNIVQTNVYVCVRY